MACYNKITPNGVIFATNLGGVQEIRTPHLFAASEALYSPPRIVAMFVPLPHGSIS